jgi:hypothetical protein
VAANTNAAEQRQERAVNDQKPFIPRQMDDAGLTPAQFRVVCRVSRRGDCTESIKNIARGCRLAIGTVKKVLPFLVANNVLAKEKRTGQTSIFKVNPPREWQVEPRPKGSPGQKTTRYPKQTGPKANSHPSPPAQTTAHKGNPPEGNPLKGEQSPEFAVRNGGNKREMWQLLNDEKSLRQRLTEERERINPDRELIGSLKNQLKQVKSEMKGQP